MAYQNRGSGGVARISPVLSTMRKSETLIARPRRCRTAEISAVSALGGKRTVWLPPPLHQNCGTPDRSYRATFTDKARLLITATRTTISWVGVGSDRRSPPRKQVTDVLLNKTGAMTAAKEIWFSNVLVDTARLTEDAQTDDLYQVPWALTQHGGFPKRP